MHDSNVVCTVDENFTLQAQANSDNAVWHLKDGLDPATKSMCLILFYICCIIERVQSKTSIV